VAHVVFLFVQYFVFRFSPNSNALEELSVRADLALNQKRVLHDLATNGPEDEEFENEFHVLSAQVVNFCLVMLLLLH